jgi:hypothetical protein
MWYKWDRIQRFTSWHNAVRGYLLMPIRGRNAATGEPAADGVQMTVNYTDPVEVASNDIRAFVEPEIANAIPFPMGEPSEPPPTPPLDL